MNWVRKLSASLNQYSLAGDDRPCRVIIEVSGNDIEPVRTLIEAKRGKIFKEIKLIPSLVAEVPPSAIQDLAQMKQVKKIIEDPKVSHC